MPVLTGGTTQSLINLNPPNVQKVVVEHVVRNSEMPSQFSIPGRLRPFSGRTPHPNNETDYDTWRASVEVLIENPSVSDMHCSHHILDSLFSPAAEMVMHLGPQAKPSAYLELLDSAYGTVEDGDELYAKFMNTFQNDREKPSAFLQRLHVSLSTSMRCGGVPSHDFDRQLLKQFCRGCWDNALIMDLQLEHKSKQATKMSRMKQHLGTTRSDHGTNKLRVLSHLQTAHTNTELEQNIEIEVLKKTSS